MLRKGRKVESPRVTRQNHARTAVIDPVRSRDDILSYVAQATTPSYRACTDTFAAEVLRSIGCRSRYQRGFPVMDVCAAMSSAVASWLGTRPMTTNEQSMQE